MPQQSSLTKLTTLAIRTATDHHHSYQTNASFIMSQYQIIKLIWLYTLEILLSLAAMSDAKRKDIKTDDINYSDSYQLKIFMAMPIYVTNDDA